jgi:hypothetical protein
LAHGTNSKAGSSDFIFFGIIPYWFLFRSDGISLLKTLKPGDGEFRLGKCTAYRPALPPNRRVAILAAAACIGAMGLVARFVCLKPVAARMAALRRLRVRAHCLLAKQGMPGRFLSTLRTGEQSQGKSQIRRYPMASLANVASD